MNEWEKYKEYKRKSDRLFFFFIVPLLLTLSIPQFTYRFNHPEKTETQLLLGFFEAYKEFFR